jgi:hypothetical protein
VHGDVQHARSAQLTRAHELPQQVRASLETSTAHADAIPEHEGAFLGRRQPGSSNVAWKVPTGGADAWTRVSVPSVTWVTEKFPNLPRGFVDVK